ncbi:MAG: helix-turn-helix domain-containing protein [Oscillospiraceae bacterium]|nr:helix-turn-helix domain-containing protein [Oscillospiraceae bacterium]
MNISDKINGAMESSWLSDTLTQEECATAKYIAQVAVIIQKQRRSKGYTQRDLAKKLGVSQAMVSRWENGEENITLTTLVKIASALEIELYNPLEKQAV